MDIVLRHNLSDSSCLIVQYAKVSHYEISAIDIRGIANPHYSYNSYLTESLPFIFYPSDTTIITTTASQGLPLPLYAQTDDSYYVYRTLGLLVLCI
jgi:hypothetical protein